jgi:hypothetical protein
MLFPWALFFLFGVPNNKHHKQLPHDRGPSTHPIRLFALGRHTPNSHVGDHGRTVVTRNFGTWRSAHWSNSWSVSTFVCGRPGLGLEVFSFAVVRVWIREVIWRGAPTEVQSICCRYYGASSLQFTE